MVNEVNILQTLQGKRIYLNPFLEEPVETKITVKIPWLERFLSFKPWVKTKEISVISSKPMRTVYETREGLIMHPAMYEEFKTNLELKHDTNE